MLTLFGKKKLTEEKVANVFVNGLLDLIDNGFGDVVGLINDSPEFIRPPEMDIENTSQFTIIVLAGNLQEVPNHFEAGQDKRITEHILTKFASVYDMDKMKLAKMVGDMRKFMSRKNHPSKNTVNGMSKAVFCKYKLNEFQEEYFRNMQAPNPILIQRLKDALDNFMWDWTLITNKYKVIPNN